ncbi:TIGR04063 family PEP-CTERM/XrtA system glycosyltransferase [Altererythrobacter sp. TH136]|uniref:TIGR04063 family PEP-CTERM/XrtA system glycosyltransferase n=1 Tax=Altererythrobacter sp. TH136 TaxID=2067415 RepID=UPI0011651D3E|nr:TIGR04063 family PEP-CTERM/XrtA system glycosyltransferase [Altererythrobacter sp. TH136]QDM40954.1 glycosyltransferase, exosortase A system-associated [Altererythrobacter sp. TH136]
MTRVLHVLDHSLPLHSGYTFRTRAIMTAQAASGLEVRGITGVRHDSPENCGGGPVAEVADGLLFHRTPGAVSGAPGIREWREIARLAAEIEKLAAEWRPDVLHAHSPALCGHAAIRAGRALGIPVVYEIRAFWEDAAVGNGTGREGSVKYRLTRALEDRAVSEADAVFTICHGLRDDLVARGHRAGKIGLSPNGVDFALFGNPPPRDDALADQLGLSAADSGGPVIGFIGSFYDYEGLDDLIAAMPFLRARHPQAALMLVGGGPMEADLRRQAAGTPGIHFTGRVPHDEVERYYSLIDVLAYPRKASRLTELVTPLKPLEAMAQGRVVAASDVGGHRELIADGVTGMLFAPNDPMACGESLADLVDARAEWAAMRERAQAHVASRHDWASNIRRYQDVYHHLLGRAPNRELSAAA